jgi:xanthine dehydrogenase accessory factor
VAALERGQAVALLTVVREGDLAPRRPNTRMLVWPDGRHEGALGQPSLEASAIADAQAALAERQTRYASYDLGEGNGQPHTAVVHIDVLLPDPTLLIVGAGHVAQPLAVIGSMMGLRVCVVDDRPEWANRERFPTAAEIAVIGYEPVHEILDPIPFPMNPATYVIVTTWGYDLPAMEQALRQDPAYIGLVASPTKARVLFQRMRQSGFADEAIRQIRAPIGLDIGAENPAEIAVSILAEVLATARGKSSRPLGEVRGQRIEALFSRPAPAPAVAAQQ